jgi:hypothetical protein
LAHAHAGPGELNIKGRHPGDDVEPVVGQDLVLVRQHGQGADLIGPEVRDQRERRDQGLHRRDDLSSVGQRLQEVLRVLAGPQQGPEDLRDLPSTCPAECPPEFSEERIDADHRAIAVTGRRESHHCGDDPIEALVAKPTRPVGEQDPGGTPCQAALVQVDSAGVSPLFQEQVDDLPGDEVVLVNQVDMSPPGQRPARPEERGERFQPGTIPLAGELRKLQLWGLGQPRVMAQLADYVCCCPVIDGH